jgi:hypothetical protein
METGKRPVCGWSSAGVSEHEGGGGKREGVKRCGGKGGREEGKGGAMCVSRDELGSRQLSSQGG